MVPLNCLRHPGSFFKISYQSISWVHAQTLSLINMCPVRSDGGVESFNRLFSKIPSSTVRRSRAEISEALTRTNGRSFPNCWLKGYMMPSKLCLIGWAYKQHRIAVENSLTYQTASPPSLLFSHSLIREESRKRLKRPSFFSTPLLLQKRLSLANLNHSCCREKSFSHLMR